MASSHALACFHLIVGCALTRHHVNMLPCSYMQHYCCSPKNVYWSYDMIWHSSTWYRMSLMAFAKACIVGRRFFSAQVDVCRKGHTESKLSWCFSLRWWSSLRLKMFLLLSTATGKRLNWNEGARASVMILRRHNFIKSIKSYNQFVLDVKQIKGLLWTTFTWRNPSCLNLIRDGKHLKRAPNNHTVAANFSLEV